MNKQKFYWLKDNRYLCLYVYINSWYRYFLYLKNKRRRITKDYIVLHGILDSILINDKDLRELVDIDDYRESEFGDFI